MRYSIYLLKHCHIFPFCVAGPAAWNCLCDELREPLLTANRFRHLMKTRLFAEVLHIMRYINLLIYLLTYRQ